MSKVSCLQVACVVVAAGIVVAAGDSATPALSAESGHSRESENATSVGQDESITEVRVARQTRLYSPFYGRQLAYYPLGAGYGNLFGNRYAYPYGSRFGSQFGSRFWSPFGNRFGNQFGNRLGSPFARPIGSSLGAFLPIQGASSAVLIPQLAVNYPSLSSTGLPYIVGIPYPVYIPLLPTGGLGGGAGTLFPDDGGFDAAAK